jgi:hypothetical protein
MNLVPLACLLEHPSWRLGGGDRGEWADRGEEAAQWRRTRQTAPGGECGVEEAAGDGAWRGRGPAAARQSGVGGWACQRREKMAQRASGRADRTSG